MHALRFFTLCVLVSSVTMVDSKNNESEEGSKTVKVECGYPGVDRHTKTVDVSRCFYGDFCCCNFDAFDLADLLLTGRESVFTGRIEIVEELPETLLVRRDVRATISVEKVFRGNNVKPSSTIQMRLSSDMFVWEETGQSRIVARQTLANEHEAMQETIVDRYRALTERNSQGDMDENEYKKATVQLEAGMQQLGELRWDWEGEIGMIFSGRDGPIPNCNNGLFTTDRFGALEVGPTYLFAMDKSSTEIDGVYQLSDKLPWSVFWGDEMKDVVLALTTTNVCLSWPEMVFEHENEFVEIGVCSAWARGSNRPWTIKRRH